MRQKGSIVASKKEAKGCKDKETQVPICDSVGITTNVTSTKETLGATVHHSFSANVLHRQTCQTIYKSVILYNSQKVRNCRVGLSMYLFFV